MTYDSETESWPSTSATVAAYPRSHRGNHSLSRLVTFASLNNEQKFLTLILSPPWNGQPVFTVNLHTIAERRQVGNRESLPQRRPRDKISTTGCDTLR